MKYHKQLIFPHRPESDEWGDCFRTCVTCLLDLEPLQVPHFGEGGPEGDDFWGPVQDWFKERGLYFVGTAYLDATQDDVLSSIGALNPGLHYMLAGTSPRGTGHVVVCKDDAMVWDPAPPGDGLEGPGTDGIWWVHFIGKMV